MGGLGGWLVVAAACACTGGVGAAAAGRPRAARALLLGGAAAAFAALSLLGVALWRVDTTLVEVATTTSRSTAGPLRLAGLWGGPSSSMLCFAAVVSVVAAASSPRLRGAALVAVAASAAALLAAAVVAQPFRRAALAPLDGAGLVPVLRRTSMLVHPPVLYAGLALVLVPAAIGVAELAGSANEGQRRLGRRAALVAWSLLAVGMVLGSRWAHREVGWGGVWAWDPVEDAALLPWLALTAGFHRRSPQGWWVGAGLLAWAGTWLTRSGRLASVHAFSDQGAVGLGLALVLLAFTVAVGVVVARGWRSPMERDAPQVAWLPSLLACARSPVGLLAGAAIGWIAVGTAWAAVGGGDRTVAAAFYVSLVGPLAVLVLAALARGAPPRHLVGAAAAGSGLLAVLAIGGWRSAGVLAVAAVAPAAVIGSLARGGRGVALAHLGFVLIVAGGVATTTGQGGTARLAVGDERRVAGTDVRLEALREVRGPDRHGVAADLVVGGRRLAPALVVVEQRGPRADVATSSGPRHEVQAALVSTGGDGTAVISVTTTPGATWVWAGGLLLAGGALAEAARRRPRRTDPPSRPATPALEPALEPAVQRA